MAVNLAGNNLIELVEMSGAEAINLLKARLLSQYHYQLENTVAVDEFLTMLTFFPLAIVQAAAYININSIDLEHYNQLYKANSKEASELLMNKYEDTGRYAESENSVATTLRISFEHIKHQDALAAKYLFMLAWVSTEAIPLTMLLDLGSLLGKKAEAIGTL